MIDPRLHYAARLSRESGLGFRITFAPALQAERRAGLPDWEGTAASAEAALDSAGKALDDWLRARLKSGEVLLRPGVPPAERGDCAQIQPAPRVALAALLRMTQHENGWTRTGMAVRVGVSQRELAELEDPDSHPSEELIAKGVKAASALALRR